MSEPQCRACYLHSLPDHERERVAAEPLTASVHYCENHQRFEKMLAEMLEHMPMHPMAHRMMTDEVFQPLHVQIPRYSGKRRA